VLLQQYVSAPFPMAVDGVHHLASAALEGILFFHEKYENGFQLVKYDG